MTILHFKLLKLKQKKSLKLLISAIAFPFLLHSQSYNFRHYQVEDGLSNNSTICCIQDTKGFLWFGTKDGLNRFDGYTFKVYRNNPDDPSSIGSNFIMSLYEDNEGVLWVGTASGLYSYNAVNESFRHLEATGTSSIKEIVADKQGTLWFIKGRNLCKYKKGGKDLITYQNTDYFDATAITISPQGQFWAGSNNGFIYKYDARLNTFSAFDVFKHSSAVIAKGIEKIYTLANGNILIGTNYQGVKVFDIKKLDYKDLFQYNDDHTGIFVRSFIQINNETFWAGTESGIFIFNTRTGSLEHLHKRYDDPYSVSDNAVYAFCKDKEGGIWITTYFGGVDYYPEQYTPFKRYFPKPGGNSLSGNVVREIHQDRLGYLWIGTDDAGLNRFDPRTNKFIQFKPDSYNSRIAYSNIHGLLADSDRLWIGTFEHGINIMDIRTHKIIKRYLAGSGPNDLKSNFIYCISKLKNGTIILGTTNGVFQYNSKQDNFSPLPHFPLHEWYSFLFEDSKGTIWGATYKSGVNYYNAQTGKFGKYTYEQKNRSSLASNRVNSVFEDSFNQLWFATENGLSKLEKKSGTFSTLDTKSGLPSSFILSILEDSQRNLWLSTTKGLVKLNLLNNKIKTFKAVNGILNDQFNFNSAYKDRSGTMYFGSVKGMISFDPKTFIENKYIPPVYITSFKISNGASNTYTTNIVSQQSTVYAKNVLLNYDQSSFSIDFAALAYTAPQMARYAYIMDGLDNNWTILKENRTVYYTDLSPGTYTFKVKNIDIPMGLKSRETTLTIKIYPPWWATNWACFFYFLVVIFTVWTALWLYFRSLKEKNQRKYDLLQIVKEKENYQSKIDFFTNVAHEIKTPLSLIKGPLENINRQFGKMPGLTENLETMNRNTVRLIELTGQLLDFRQTEADAFALNYADVDIINLLTETFESFKTLAEQKALEYKLHLPSGTLKVRLDADAFNKILNNLFSNAIKYGEHKVSVRLFAVKKGDCDFRIEFKNDGMLIPYELSEKIFEPFFRLPGSQTQKGTGIGLAIAATLVQLHNGQLFLKETAEKRNIFCLILPL